MSFDDRIVRVTVDFGNGQKKTYEDLRILAQGRQEGCAILSECSIKIFNMNKNDRDLLLKDTSPFSPKTGINYDRKPKVVTLEVGRKSYGTFQIFKGNVIASNPTQPPDIGVTLKSMTGSLLLWNIIATSQPESTQLSTIAKTVADDIDASLDFQATDKAINNYSFTGSVIKQMQKLEDVGGVNVFLNNDKLVVKDKGKPLNGNTFVLNQKTGLIGIPEVTEQGIRAKCLINPAIKLGGSIKIESENNPAANGTYTIYKLNYDIANRDTPFYYIIESTRFLL